MTAKIITFSPKDCSKFFLAAAIFFYTSIFFVPLGVFADTIMDCANAGGEYSMGALTGPPAYPTCVAYCTSQGSTKLRTAPGTDCCCKAASSPASSGSVGPTSRPASLVGNNIGGLFDINPFGTNTDVRKIVGDVIRYVLGIIGTIALVIFFYGGIQWMTSLGEEARITKGRETMVWAGLGMIVIFASYTIVNFILSRLLGS